MIIGKARLLPGRDDRILAGQYGYRKDQIRQEDQRHLLGKGPEIQTQRQEADEDRAARKNAETKSRISDPDAVDSVSGKAQDEGNGSHESFHVTNKTWADREEVWSFAIEKIEFAAICGASGVRACQEESLHGEFCLEAPS